MKRALLALSMAAMLALGAGSALAAPQHEHTLTTPANTVEIGPDFCSGKANQIAFENFHGKVHRGAPEADNDIDPVRCPPTP